MKRLIKKCQQGAEIYVTPYGNFSPRQYPMLALLMERLQDYDDANPLLEKNDKNTIKIKSKGRLNTGVVNLDWINYIVNQAKNGGYDPVQALGLTSRESTVGNDTDGTTGSLWSAKTRQKMKSQGIDSDHVEQHIGLPIIMSNIRKYIRKNNIYEYPYLLPQLSYRYNNIIGNHDHYNIQFPYYQIYNESLNNSNSPSDRDNQEKYLESNYSEQSFQNIPTNAILDALKYYNTGNYNKGWSGEYKAVDKDSKEIKTIPEFMNIINKQK